MKKIQDLSRLLPAACFSLVVAVGSAALIPSAMAQEEAQETGDGFTDDPGEPTEVVSDTAEWKRAENLAIFTGRVDAVQGTMRLRADKVFVHYVQKDKAEGEA